MDGIPASHHGMQRNDASAYAYHMQEKPLWVGMQAGYCASEKTLARSCLCVSSVKGPGSEVALNL